MKVPIARFFRLTQIAAPTAITVATTVPIGISTSTSIRTRTKLERPIATAKALLAIEQLSRLQ